MNRSGHSRLFCNINRFEEGKVQSSKDTSDRYMVILRRGVNPWKRDFDDGYDNDDSGDDI